LSDKDIEEYFNQCISQEKIFLYTGGYANALLTDESDYNPGEQFPTFSLGCTGGVEQGRKFNKLMINYIKVKGLVQKGAGPG
jgi:hypothetical protein